MIQTTGKTHIVGGLLAGLLVNQYICLEPSGLIIAGISSLLPDLDTPTSKLGRKLPVLAFTNKLVFGHRGFLHSFLSAGIYFIIIMQLIGTEIALMFLAGYLSHLFLDMLTPSGVPLLWPIKTRITLSLIKTGSLLEYCLLGVMCYLGYIFYF